MRKSFFRTLVSVFRRQPPARLDINAGWANQGEYDAYIEEMDLRDKVTPVHVQVIER